MSRHKILLKTLPNDKIHVAPFCVKNNSTASTPTRHIEGGSIECLHNDV